MDINSWPDSQLGPLCNSFYCHNGRCKWRDDRIERLIYLCIMVIDSKTVDKLADLAKLEFDDASKQEIIKDLNRIVTFIEKLNELDTSSVEPLIYLTDETNIMRDDVVKQEITQQEALKNAPKKDSDYIKAPKVIDKK
jgi:aspartyl-tRNA(Asn)/glutamyl-tRNA(Gln) amidotransferase subunit C